MIADLSEALENCASDGIKAMYDSYEVSALDSAMIDGRLMGASGAEFCRRSESAVAAQGLDGRAGT